MNLPPADASADAFGRFFLPGPTEVLPQILAAQSQPMIGHRGPGIQTLMEELQTGLADVFRTERPVFVSSSSATGLMEAAARNAGPGRVLALVNGAFSGRFATISRACGLEIDEWAVPWGGHHDPDALADRLARSGYDAVTVVHSETSTGALNDLQALAGVVAEHPGTLLLVDSVTGIGGAEVRTDAWALDFVLTGSQKALALPPGLAFGVASAAMMERSRSAPAKGVYFDLEAFATNLAKLQTPNTPALSLLYALRAQLGRIAEETMEGRWSRHREMAGLAWAWVDRMREERGIALEVLAAPGHRSPTVTCVRLPAGVAGPAVVAEMAARGWVIGGGYGKLKETTVRIGHMGEHTPAETAAVLGALEEVLVHVVRGVPA